MEKIKQNKWILEFYKVYSASNIYLQQKKVNLNHFYNGISKKSGKFHF